MAEENNDYKKYFDPKDYITKIISVSEEEVEDTNEKNKDIRLLTELLTDPKHKDVREETLLMLKKEEKGETLLKAIAKEENKEIQYKLIAACWESEINMSKYLPFFVLLTADENYLVSLEAITVISEMQGPFEPNHLSEAIQKIKQTKQVLSDEKQVLFNDLLDKLAAFNK